MNKQSLVVILLCLLMTPIYAQNESSILIPTDAVELELEAFKRVRLKSGFTVNVIQREGPQKVIVHTKDSLLLAKIEAKVKGDALELSMERGSRFDFSSDTQVDFLIMTEQLDGLEVFGSGIVQMKQLSADQTLFNLSVSGSGQIEVGDLQTPSLKAAITGSGFIGVDKLTTQAAELQIAGGGRIDMGGTAAQVSATVRGTGQIETSFLETSTTQALIQGSGTIYCYPLKELVANIQGSGLVSYRGTPTVSLQQRGKKQVQKTKSLPPRKNRLLP